MYKVEQCRAVSAPWYNGVEFLIRDRGMIATKITLTTEVLGQTVEPSFSLSMSAAQILMDDLWNAGLRPTEGTGSAGALAATQKHLEDMRTLVFSKK